jgi:hypothetical protein
MVSREFVFLAVRQTWSEDRMFFLDREGRQFSLPVGWTDAMDAFVTMAPGRCPFRFADLVELRRSRACSGPASSSSWSLVRAARKS